MYEYLYFLETAPDTCFAFNLQYMYKHTGLALSHLHINYCEWTDHSVLFLVNFIIVLQRTLQGTIIVRFGSG